MAGAYYLPSKSTITGDGCNGLDVLQWELCCRSEMVRRKVTVDVGSQNKMQCMNGRIRDCSNYIKVMTVRAPLQATIGVPLVKRGRFMPNLAVNMINFAVAVCIGFWLTPYLIRHLGVAVYGLIPLAASVSTYLGLATVTLNGAVGRFLTVAMERHDTREANRIFNTALIGNLIVVCALVVPAVLISSHASAFFNVPPGYERPFGWLFFCIICSFFLTAVNTSFSLAAYCRNRFDLSSGVEILSNLTRIGTIVVLFRYCAPQVWHIGAGSVAAVTVSMVGSVIIWRRLTPMLHIQLRSFNLESLRELMSLGSWALVNQIGVLLLLSIDLIVVNRLFGAVAGGRYGAIMQWSSFLRGLGGVIAGIFGPTIFMLYARLDIPGLVRYAQQAVKFLGLAMALPIGIISGFSASFLFVWLGPNFVPLAPLMSLMTIHLAVNLSVLPLNNIRVATKKLRVPGVVMCITGIMNLGLALLLAGPVGWGLYGVAAAGAIMLAADNLIFGPWYAARILGIPRSTFFRGSLPNICTTLGLTGACWAVSHYFQIHSWLGLIIGSGAVAAAYSLYVFAIALNKGERETVVRMLRTFVLHA